ncbi:MAG: D-alanyl-D-alanine carboxypeptidase [Acaryochloris sp. RU_4_1]|nr:D-alanyl-D-alanine carboxypeptidase [Acaryochloris sp. RU_4_1]
MISLKKDLYRYTRLSLHILACTLILGGCSSLQVEPPPQPPIHSPTPSPAPLALALAAPKTIANPQIQQYLSRLDTLGVPLASQGVWIQTQDTLLANHQGAIPLPAASLTKVATSLAVLQKLGPDHRFVTTIGYSGVINKGILQGDLVIEGGADSFFVWEDAIALGNLLQQHGIRQVQGNLIVVGAFYMNYERDPSTAATLFQQGINHTLWPAAAQTQYQTLPPNTLQPQVKILGSIQVAPPLPRPLTPLLRHRSLPVAELLKKMNQYSNNAMAEMLADQVGGSQKVAQIAAQAAGVPENEIQLVNGSGLSVDNRISPRATCAMFQAIARLLHPQKMTIADIFAVTGTDPGILNERSLPQRTVVKSGTLDGVSALAGALPTQKQGVIWFALINGEGDVDQFRTQQETLLQTLLQTWGNPAQPTALLAPSPSRQKLTATSDLMP